MITRKQYLEDSENLHDTYYRQFVTDGIKQMVLNRFGLDKLKVHVTKKMDEKGYIPLDKWDAMAGGYGSKLGESKMKEVGDYPSLAGAVCILKQAAKMIVEENE
jgi:hypothetical protein